MAIIKKAPNRPYGEKKSSMNSMVTPTAQMGLDQLAHRMNISRSEFLERVGRGLLQVVVSEQ
jgi:hypothetical protein